MALPFRPSLAVLAAATAILGCAAAGSQDRAGPGTEVEDGGGEGTSPDGGAAGTSPDGGATADDGGSSPGHAEGGGGFDSGPPASVGGDGDSGSGGSDAGCTSLAQCPYQSATNVAGVACTAGACVITCNGETYDVNGVLSDGCEIAGACVKSQGTALCPVDDHTQAKGANVGSFPCDDTSSAQTLTGAVPSDDRVHTPAIDGFDTTSGAAPDYFTISATGGALCQDDANFALTMNGSNQPDCYILTLLTDKNGGQTCTTVSGTCSITNSSGSYSDNSTIYVSVAKNDSCPAATTPDVGTFTITGHL
jgi:hypothetical protein